MSMWMALLKRKLSLFTLGLRNLTATLQAAALQNKERTKAASSNIIAKRPDEKKKKLGFAQCAYTVAWKAAVLLVMDLMWE